MNEYLHTPRISLKCRDKELLKYRDKRSFVSRFRLNYIKLE